MPPRILQIIILLLITSCSSVPLWHETPLPSNLSISPPDSSLPIEVKALSGKWVGQWNSPYRWNSTVCVEKADKESAELVHSWGDYVTSRGSCHCAPDWQRIRNVRVNYSEGKASLEFWANYRNKNSKKGHGSQVLFTVRQERPNEMEGQMITGHRHRITIVMKRVE